MVDNEDTGGTACYSKPKGGVIEDPGSTKNNNTTRLRSLELFKQVEMSPQRQLLQSQRDDQIDPSKLWDFCRLLKDNKTTELTLSKFQALKVLKRRNLFSQNIADVAFDTATSII